MKKTLFIASCYGFVLCLIGAVLALYQATAPGAPTFDLLSRKGIVIAGTFSGVLLSFLAAVWSLRGLDANECRRAVQSVVLQAIMLVLVAGTLEIALRVLALETPGATFIGPRLLHPRIWPVVAERQMAAVKEAATADSFQVGDPFLGWTLGNSRQSRNGLYRSSAEGLRSAEVGAQYAGSAAPVRVALLGDSFVFGEEVPFAETMGAALQLSLGSQVQVLNFGVPGYGVDQMVLRYDKDVRTWSRPGDVVVLGFIEDDMERSMLVYPVIGRPHWLTPWSKPHFVVEGSHLAIKNQPTAGPEQVFGAPSIEALPLVKDDAAYCACEWDRPGWGVLYRSYVMRFVLSFLPQYRYDRPATLFTTRMAVHEKLFQRFDARVRADGAVPVIVILPTAASYDAADTPMPLPESKRVLTQAGVPFLDLTTCLKQVPPAERYVRGAEGHYSKRGNEAIAACLLQTLTPLIEQHGKALGVAKTPL
ncbi:MAG: hypothetical protein U0172_09665 [Nitrospiraceae bacterium]